MKRKQHKRKFNKRFSILAVVLSSIIAIIMVLLIYGLIRAHLLSDSVLELDHHMKMWAELKQDRSARLSSRLDALLAAAKQRKGINFVGLYDEKQKLVRYVPSSATSVNSSLRKYQLSEIEQGNLRQVTQQDNLNVMILPKVSLFSVNSLMNGTEEINYYKMVKYPGKKNYVLRVVGDSQEIYGKINKFAFKIIACVFLLSFCLIVLLFWVLYRTRQTIHDYQDDLYDQVEKLSAALESNQRLQKSMRTASSRAIELNEQFLRKIGADLHDGPAQSISYAVLSLDRVNQADDNSEIFNHQYHSVKDALSYSIEEIRTIAAGLVLPQIESLSLPESVIKVIRLHEKNSEMQVKHFFKELPDVITLPVKICAYRLVQESLNNATRHGQAELCRISVSYTNERLQFIIKDNGKGFNVGELKVNDEHLGLMGMQDRIESLGGSFIITSEPGVGSIVKAVIPVYK